MVPRRCYTSRMILLVKLSREETYSLPRTPVRSFESNCKSGLPRARAHVLGNPGARVCLDFCWSRNANFSSLHTLQRVDILPKRRTLRSVVFALNIRYGSWCHPCLCARVSPNMMRCKTFYAIDFVFVANQVLPRRMTLTFACSCLYQ